MSEGRVSSVRVLGSGETRELVIQLDTGICGTSDFSLGDEATLRCAEALFLSALVDQEVASVPQHAAAMAPYVGYHLGSPETRAAAALEWALWDARANLTCRGLDDLLGGRRRRNVAVVAETELRSMTDTSLTRRVRHLGDLSLNEVEAAGEDGDLAGGYLTVDIRLAAPSALECLDAAASVGSFSLFLEANSRRNLGAAGSAARSLRNVAAVVTTGNLTRDLVL